MKINPGTIAKHTLFWILYALYQLISNSWQEKGHLLLTINETSLSHFVVVIALVYINLYVVLPLFYNSKRYIGYFCCILILIFFGGTIQRLLTHTLWSSWGRLYSHDITITEPENFWITLRILRNAFELFPVIAVTTVIAFMKMVYQQEMQQLRLVHEKKAIESDFLKGQINPHFFFNTLTSIHALSKKGSALTSEMILQLSELMQYTLYKSAGNKVLLSDEIEHLQQYINIERLRFDAYGEVSFVFPDDPGDIMVAPLLLMTFVENAFKHGIPEADGWIKIVLNVTNQQLQFTVKNNYQQDAPSKSGGLGINNLSKRLELNYQGKYNLSLSNKNGIHTASLSFDL